MHRPSWGLEERQRQPESPLTVLPGCAAPLPPARPQARPVPSLLRGFSAPVKLTVEGQTEDDLAFLLAHDTGEDGGRRPGACKRLLWACFGLQRQLSGSGACQL